MHKRRIGRIVAFLFLILSFTSIPSMCIKAEASPRYSVRYTIRYKITYRRTRAKAKPTLSSKKLKFTQGEIRSITLNKAKASKVKWKSSNKKIATVKKDGKWCDIKAKKPGKVTITAKYKGKKYKCKVVIKKKQSRAFSCWTNNQNETLYFKSAAEAYGDGKAWYMYSTSNDSWLSDGYIGFDSPLYPITLSFTVGDPSIIDAEWDEYDEDLGWRLNFYPQRAGSTYVTISNSYNNQTMYFPIVVTDDYVIPGEGYVELESNSYEINDQNQTAVIRVRGSKDVTSFITDIRENNYYHSYLLEKDKCCYIEKSELKDGWFTYYVKPKKNGTVALLLQDSDYTYEPVYATIDVRIPNKSITTDYDDLDMIVGDSAELNVFTDYGSDVSIESTGDISLTPKWDSSGTSCKLTIKAQNEGVGNITIRDNNDPSIIKVVNVNVGIIEATGIKITNKISSMSPSIMSGRIYYNTKVLNTTVYPADATYKDVTWESSDPAIATVSNGLVEAHNDGTVTIRAYTHNGYSDECTIKISIRSFG